MRGISRVGRFLLKTNKLGGQKKSNMVPNWSKKVFLEKTSLIREIHGKYFKFKKRVGWNKDVLGGIF